MQHDTQVIVSGVSLRFLQMGHGPALVLVHGLVGSSENWQQNMAALAESRTVYALDLANMGKSERVAGLDAGLEATADLVAGFMEAVGIAAADVGGHSHGGAISMMLAARHPQRVRSLILFAPANPFCTAGRKLIAFYNSRLGAWFARQIPRLPVFTHHMAHKRMYGDPATATRAALSTYTDGLNRESIDHILGITRRWWVDMARLEERLAELTGIPVLLIWGDRDLAVSIQSGQRLATRLGARLIVLPGVGHLSFAERPDFCNRTVSAWLA